mmetsp:Transcript_1023/g.156  ORF Transcript_1023/g.156 Transcript_1023/m.156 type:complete len:112 (-) Transcript_1023:125-460(-)
MHTKQVYSGIDEKNKNLNNYWIFKKEVEMGESVTISFDDLMDNTDYEVHVTVASKLLYDEPPMLYSDSQVRKLSFRTPVNPNLLYNEISVLRSLKDINPSLVKVLEPIIIS